MQAQTYTAFDGLKFGLVDDNPYFRRLVRTMLAGFGVRDLVDASTLAAGWEIVASGRPDIMLVDWNLGASVGNGVQLLDRIRTHTDDRLATQTVVFLSAHSDRRHVLSAVRLGANDFIVKPVSARQLYERLRRVVLAPRAYTRRDGRAVLLPPGTRGGIGQSSPAPAPIRAPAPPPRPQPPQPPQSKVRAPAAPPPPVPAPEDDVLYI